MASNDFRDYLTGPPRETWQAALSRLAALCRLDLDSYETGEKVVINFSRFFDDGTLFEITNKEPRDNMRAYEAKYRVSVPTELVELMCTHGAFSIFGVRVSQERRSDNILNIYDSKDTQWCPNIKTLTQAIAFNHTEHFAETELNADEITSLDSSYFCFGSLLGHQQTVLYLYFDRNGKFGTYAFRDEDYPENIAALKPLLSGSATPSTLDEVMVLAINQTILLILEGSEVYAEDL